MRALPPVIEAFATTGRAALAIDFGGVLGVELRQAAEGVEVRLLASASLRPAIQPIRLFLFAGVNGKMETNSRLVCPGNDIRIKKGSIASEPCCSLPCVRPC